MPRTFKTVSLLLVLLVLSASLCFGQGQAVNITSAPPPDNWVKQYFYSGSNLAYVCQAASLQSTTTFYKSSSTLTQIAVATNVGTITFSSTSYLWVGAQITVAGSATTALNGTYKITGVSSSTATITTSGVSDGTYNDSTLTVSTKAPLLNANVWAIHAYAYDGSNNLIGDYWANTPSHVVPNGLACSNRASY